MAYEMKNNSGSIFKNDRKTAANHPDYRGKIMVEGKIKELSLWIKEGKNGINYLSVSVQDEYKAEPKKQENNDLPW